MSIFKFILKGMLILGAAVVAFVSFFGPPPSKVVHAPQAPARTTVVPTMPYKNVWILDTKWRGSASGVIAKMTFSVQNRNEHDVKDVGISCSFFGKSGTEISSKTTIVYELITANKTRSLKDVNFGIINSQSASVSCDVVSAKRA